MEPFPVACIEKSLECETCEECQTAKDFICNVAKHLDTVSCLAWKRGLENKHGVKCISGVHSHPLTASVFVFLGESGLGKSTLINSLFLTDLYSPEYPGPSHRIKKTVQVISFVYFEESNFFFFPMYHHDRNILYYVSAFIVHLLIFVLKSTGLITFFVN